MRSFNSLSYATQLIQAGVPRDQAEVHAQVLQNIYDEEHKQYATKNDFIQLSHDVKLQMNQLEIKTNQLETKIDHVEIKIVEVETKIVEVEKKLSREISGLKTSIDQCKDEFLNFRSDLSVLKTSHRYMVWIGGGLATICLSVLGLCISMFMHTVK